MRIARETVRNLPFIVVTGSISEEAAVQCMKEGATDYLLKDRLARLGGAVRQALEGRRLLDERVLVEEHLRHRNRELTLLNRIIAASTEQTDETVFLHVACREIRVAFDATLAVAGMFDAERTEAIIVARDMAPGVEPPSTRRFPVITTNITGLASRLDTPLVMDDVAHSPFLTGYAAYIEHNGFSSMLLIPLEVGGRAIGGLGCVSTEPHHFTAEHVTLAQSVADQYRAPLPVPDRSATGVFSTRLSRRRATVSSSWTPTPRSSTSTRDSKP